MPIHADPIKSDVPGSFAWGVLHDRHPAIIQQMLQTLPYPPHIRQALDKLGAEIMGPIKPLPADANDHGEWARWCSDYIGKSWFEVPFLWAESYFYRKLLDAVDYFKAGPWCGIDPFEPQKAAELADPRLGSDIGALAVLETRATSDQFTAALDAALWGNRADLGFLLSDPDAEHAKQADYLVADDSSTVRALLQDNEPGTVCIVADNAGRELIPDLFLIDLLLRTSNARTVDLHLKPQPYYVSDATNRDLIACLRWLAATPTTEAIASRISDALERGRLMVSTHPFYCAPLSYHDLPTDLAERFGSAQLTIFKGDLNYRRVVGDSHWSATTPFADAVGYFPGPLATLRTLKSDVIVGLSPDEVSALDSTGAAWRTAGTHGLIQASR